MKSFCAKSIQGRCDVVPRLGQNAAHPRGTPLAANGEIVVARPKVLLAQGDKNGIWQIARSAICFRTREQTTTTTVRNICRAFEKPSDVILPTLNASPISIVKKIMS